MWDLLFWPQVIAQGWYRRLRCALVWFGGESGISSPSVLAGSARATMRLASALTGGRGVSRLSRRGRRGGSAAGMAGKWTSGSQSSGVGAGAAGILGLSGCSPALLLGDVLGYEHEPQNECRSDVDDDALDTLPLLQAERYPLGVLVDEMRFMSDGGVRAGRIGIWKCRACGAEIAGLRLRSDGDRERSAGEGDTSFDMLLRKALRRGGGGGGGSRTTAVGMCAGSGVG